MTQRPPAAIPTQGARPAGGPDRAQAPTRRPDSTAFSEFYDHYLPRVLGFAQRRADGEAAERLTEAILTEAMLAGAQGGAAILAPGPAADDAVVAAARRVAGRLAAGR